MNSKTDMNIEGIVLPRQNQENLPPY